MKKRICAEILTADKLREFPDSEKIDIDVVTEQPSDIEVCKQGKCFEHDLFRWPAHL